MVNEFMSKNSQFVPFPQSKPRNGRCRAGKGRFKFLLHPLKFASALFRVFAAFLCHYSGCSMSRSEFWLFHHIGGIFYPFSCLFKCYQINPVVNALENTNAGMLRVQRGLLCADAFQCFEIRLGTHGNLCALFQVLPKNRCFDYVIGFHSHLQFIC